MDFPTDDPAYHELSGHAMIEIRQGMIYFRPEGRDGGVYIKVFTMLNHPTTCPTASRFPPGNAASRQRRRRGILGVFP